ncbi:MAG: helix-turn-helix transcriptional regulator [Proteobacteria bacterium]|nr:helix-turn-helix transcriptional regulator [Pseudomonadota bacterium]
MAFSNSANHCRLGPEAIQKLPEIIRTLRKRKNLSRGQIAKRLKVSEPTVYNIELGRTRITLGFLIGFLRVVQIDSKPKAS